MSEIYRLLRAFTQPIIFKLLKLSEVRTNLMSKIKFRDIFSWK